MSSALFELRVQLEQNQAYNLDKNVVFSVFFTANTIPVPVRIWSKLIANCQTCDFCDKIVVASSSGTTVFENHRKSLILQHCESDQFCDFLNN